MRRSFQVVLVAMMLLCAAANGLLLAGTQVEEAQQAAQAWLVLVDAGKYPQSWDAAAALLKQAVPREKWTKDFGAQHQQLGQVLSRQRKGAQVATKVKDIPEGEYVVIQFDTAFVNKRQVQETVVTSREKDGRWRVAGYWIQ